MQAPILGFAGVGGISRTMLMFYRFVIFRIKHSTSDYCDSSSRSSWIHHVHYQPLQDGCAVMERATSPVTPKPPVAAIIERLGHHLGVISLSHSTFSQQSCVNGQFLVSDIWSVVIGHIQFIFDFSSQPILIAVD